MYIEDAHNKVLHFPIQALSKPDQEFVSQKIAEVEEINQRIAATRTENGVVPDRFLSKAIMICLIFLFAASFIFVRNRIKQLAFSGSVLCLGILGFVSGFIPKSSQQTQTTTNPLTMDSAFVPFKPDVYTHWDQTYFYVESNGLAKHEMMTGITGWQQQVPIPQCYTGTNAWSIPLNPVIATTPVPVNTQHFLRGAIAVAVNGIAIFNPYTNTGVDAFLDGQLDNWGGHSGRADDYHYHTAPMHLYSQSNTSLPIAYGLDGFPVYGSLEPNGAPMLPLDDNHGHFGANGIYHYHGTPAAPYMIGKMVGQVTEDNTLQIIPQATAKPARPSGTPLNGASITGFTPNGTGNGYNMTYTNAGQNYAWNYSWTNNGVFTFNYVTPTGTTTTNYTRNQPPCVLTTANSEIISEKSNFLVYPNPGKGFINVVLGKGIPESEIQSMTLYNVKGEMVHRIQGFQKELKVSGLSKGSYLLKLELKKSFISQKLFVE